MVVDLHHFPAPSERQQQSSATTDNTGPATPAVRLIGPRATIDSARMLLGVILEYVDKEREMRESDTVVRERLLVRNRHCCIFVVTVRVAGNKEKFERQRSISFTPNERIGRTRWLIKTR